MVAKISHGASLYGALSYNHEKVFQGTAEILSGHRMISDARDYRARTCVWFSFHLKTI